MSQTDLVYELLRTDLTAQRTLLDQVANAISSQFGISTTEFETFFQEKFPTLEDYEVDLLFSPQYTPAEHNRLEYIPMLGDKALSAEDITLLKRRLSDEKLATTLLTADGQCTASVPVHDVFIDRYVKLLKLDQPLPEAIANAIRTDVPEVSRNELNLLGRDDIWRSQNRQDILLAFLKVFAAENRFSTLKASFLTNFVRTYRPNSLLDIKRQLETLIESCRSDMEKVSGRGFQDEYLRSLHGREAKNTAVEQDVWAHYKHMMEMAEELIADYEKIAHIAPEFLERARQGQLA